MSGRELLVALYDSECFLCEREVREGMPIRWVRGGWAHDTCPDPSNEKRPHEITCETCWLVHPEGACDR